MPAINTVKMTARQFIAMGDDPPGVRLELVDGEIEITPSPDLRTAFVKPRLSAIIGEHVTPDIGQLYGGVNTIFGQYDVRRPDIIFVSKQRLHLIGEEAAEGPPDFCTEILSPSSVKTDREVKFQQYAEGGVAHYWIVDPIEHTIEGYRLVAGKYEPTGGGADREEVSLPPFDGLTIPLQKIWWPQDGV